MADDVRYLRTRTGVVHRVVFRDGAHLTDERCNFDQTKGWLAITEEEAMASRRCQWCMRVPPAV